MSSGPSARTPATAAGQQNSASPRSDRLSRRFYHSRQSRGQPGTDTPLARESARQPAQSGHIPGTIPFPDSGEETPTMRSGRADVRVFSRDQRWLSYDSLSETPLQAVGRRKG